MRHVQNNFEKIMDSCCLPDMSSFNKQCWTVRTSIIIYKKPWLLSPLRRALVSILHFYHFRVVNCKFLNLSSCPSRPPVPPIAPQLRALTFCASGSLGFSVFPGSQVLKMDGFAWFPGSRVIKKDPFFKYFQVHKSLKYIVFNISRSPAIQTDWRHTIHTCFIL